MTDNPVDRPKCIAVQGSFNNHAITAIAIGADEFFVAAEVEAALDYAKFKLTNALARWAGQGHMQAGVHFQKLENDKLASFKAAAGYLLSIDSKARHLMVLTRRGLYRVLQLSRRPLAIAFQDWLETEVLPSIEKTGRYDVATHPAPSSAPAVTLPAPAPSASLDELRYRVEGLERIASTGQLDRATASALLAQAAALLVAGAGGRGDGGGGPQLPAVAMSGGEADAEHPGLVPLAWAARPQVLMGRNQRPVPGLPAELDGKTPQDLMVYFVNHHHFFSDRAWRFFARWMVDAGILHAPMWLEVFNAAHRDQRAGEDTRPPRRRRPPPVSVTS